MFYYLFRNFDKQCYGKTTNLERKSFYSNQIASYFSVQQLKLFRVQKQYSLIQSFLSSKEYVVDLHGIRTPLWSLFWSVWHLCHGTKRNWLCISINFVFFLKICSHRVLYSIFFFNRVGWRSENVHCFFFFFSTLHLRKNKVGEDRTTIILQKWLLEISWEKKVRVSLP